MIERATTANLLATQQITEDDVSAVISAFVGDPRPGLFDLAAGYRVNVAGAIDEGPLLRELLGRAGASELLKRSTVRVAVMQAVPERA